MKLSILLLPAIALLSACSSTSTQRIKTRVWNHGVPVATYNQIISEKTNVMGTGSIDAEGTEVVTTAQKAGAYANVEVVIRKNGQKTVRCQRLSDTTYMEIGGGDLPKVKVTAH